MIASPSSTGLSSAVAGCQEATAYAGRVEVRPQRGRGRYPRSTVLLHRLQSGLQLYLDHCDLLPAVPVDIRHYLGFGATRSNWAVSRAESAGGTITSIRVEESERSTREPDSIENAMKFRRLFLRVIFIAVASGIGLERAQSASPPPDLKAKAGYRPNVLFLAIDDLNDWIGAAGGHPQARTPNLDRLISQSVFFRNAHTAAPVCSASRHALLSGLRPSSTGWYSNSSKTREEYTGILGSTVPMPTHFKRNGYKTMAAGKIYHKGTSDIEGYDYWDEARPKYKWPSWLAERGHGYQGESGGHFHPFPRDGGAIYQMYQEGVSGQSLCWGALEEVDMPPEGMPDEQVADWAVQRLGQEHDKPFFLAVGFVRPHVPYTAPKKFFDIYPLDDIVMPEVPSDEMDDIPILGKGMAYGTIEGGDHRNVLDVGPDYWREMVRAYLACVTFVDEQAGKVLRALADSPYADNTIVVFWSDHGQHLGEKRHWRKQALWEESTRVPLAIRLPKSVNGGDASDQPASLLDIYPTLLELIDLPHVNGLEGTSLLPQLQNPAARRSEPAITTWYYNNHSVRDLNFRYIRYRDGAEELYDHRSDPGEHHSLAADPKYAQVKKRLAAYLPKENAVPSSIKNGGLDSFGRKVERLRTGGVPDWLGQDPAQDTVR